jgi:hypothetical protein
MRMAIGKLLFILSYLGIGIWAIFLLPTQRMTHSELSTPPKYIYGFIILLGCVSTTLIPWSYVLFALILSLLIAHRNDLPYRSKIGYGIFLGLIISSFIPWWMHNDVNRLKLDLIQSLLPVVISGLLFFTLSGKNDSVPTKSKPWKAPLYLGFGLAVIALSLTAGISLNTQSINQWHHWGAYIGPAQLLAQGVIPFNEIPMQYGLGPSLLISFGCQWDCWNGLYWISGVFTIGMACLLAYIGLKLNQVRTFLRELLVLLTVLTTCVIWTALPMALESVTAMPSTSGLRFLPGVLMAALLIWTLQKNRVLSEQNSTTPPFSWKYLSHNALWIFSFYYSPEAGIQTSVLWFGYCLLLQIYSGRQSCITATLIASLKLLSIFILGIVIFCAGIFLIWGQLPNLSTYLVYILHPPGPLPVNQNGPVWFAVMVTILFFIWSKQQKKEGFSKPENTTIWIVFLLCYANFTYFIGRSADNNILNLLPYFGVLLIGLQSHLEKGISKVIATILLTSIFAWLPVMGWGNYGRAIQAGEFFSLSPGHLSKTFTRTNSSSDKYFKDSKEIANNKNIGQALEFIASKYNEPVEIIDRFNLLDTSQTLAPWNGLHGPANFFYVPSPLRQRYLANVKAQLNRPGWILINVQLKEGGAFIEDYRAIYREDVRFSFGDYQAIRFIP